MAEQQSITTFGGKRPNLLVHAYRGIPEVHSWSHYKKLDHHWAVCGFQTKGSGGIQPLEFPMPETGTRGSCDLTKVTCAFCLDLVERTQRRQSLIPSGRELVTIHDSCFQSAMYFDPERANRRIP